MASRRKTGRTRKSRRRRSRVGLRWGIAALAVLAAVGALAFAQSGLDRVGAMLAGGGQPRATAVDPTRTAALPAPHHALPRTMQAPRSRPQASHNRPQALPRGTDGPRPGTKVAALPRATDTPAIRRPPAGLGQTAAFTPAGSKPVRKPQEGDCACPYDLMMDGSACGARSTYLAPTLAPGRERPACYR